MPLALRLSTRPGHAMHRGDTAPTDSTKTQGDAGRLRREVSAARGTQPTVIEVRVLPPNFNVPHEVPVCSVFHIIVNEVPIFSDQER